MGASCAFELRWGLEVGPGLARCNGVLEDDQALHAGSINADLQDIVHLHHPKTRQLPRPESLRGTQFCQTVDSRMLRIQTEQGDAVSSPAKYICSFPTSNMRIAIPESILGSTVDWQVLHLGHPDVVPGGAYHFLALTSRSLTA
jgi:hypothetical protein